MPETVTTTAPTEMTTTAAELSPALTPPSVSAPAAKADKLEQPPVADTSNDVKGATVTSTTPATGVDSILAQLKNLPVSQVDALLEAIDAETGANAAAREEAEEDDEEDLQVDESSVSREGPVRYADMEPGMQKAIAAVHNHQLEMAVTAAIDSDKDLSYNMAGLGPKAREAVVATVKDFMERQIGAEGSKFDFNWNRVAKSAFAQARSRIEPFFERPTPRAGMGPGQGGEHYMARQIKEPQRVPAYADANDYQAYIAQKLAYNQALAERETQGQVPGV